MENDLSFPKIISARFAVLSSGLLDTGLIISGRGVERDVEPVLAIDRDNCTPLRRDGCRVAQRHSSQGEATS